MLNFLLTVVLMALLVNIAFSQVEEVDSVAQEQSVVVDTAPVDPGIPAVDSDFLFLMIMPSTLPFEGAGMGVFAKVDIPANEILCEYRGATIPSDKPFESNYIYSSKKITGETFNIVPDMKKPICAIINDCALIVGNTYTPEELDNFDTNSTAKMPTYPGYQYNAFPMFTSLGKVFIVSTVDIPAGAEIFYSYGNNYWVARIRYPEYFKF